MPMRRAAVSPRRVAVTRALYELGGADRPVDTEDIALRAHSLLEGAFTWRKYTQYINPDLVRIALVRAAKIGLVTGSGRHGWRLTENGIRVAEDFGAKLPEAGRAQERAAHVLERIAQSAAVRAVRAAGVEAVAFRDAERLFGLNGYVTDRRLRRRAVEKVLEEAKGDVDVYAAVRAVVAHFGPELEAKRR